MPSELTLEARKILSKWARWDLYVYMRPMSSVYLVPQKKHTVYWIVSVEYRAMEYKQLRGEGYDLSEVIVKLDEDVPNRKKVQPGYKPGTNTGWLAAKEVAERQREEIRNNVVAFERPRKRKKKKANAVKSG